MPKPPTRACVLYSGELPGKKTMPFILASGFVFTPGAGVMTSPRSLKLRLVWKASKAITLVSRLTGIGVVKFSAFLRLMPGSVRIENTGGSEPSTPDGYRGSARKQKVRVVKAKAVSGE